MTRPAHFTDDVPGTRPARRQLHGWRRRSVARVKSSLSEQDVLLGFGLVMASCVVVLVASSFFPMSAEGRRSIVAILMGTAALDLGVLALPGRLLKGPVLLCFPILLVASHLALSLLVPQSEAVAYVGFFTLAFVFIGVTQARGVGALFTVVAAPAWAVIERPWTTEVGVKLVLAIAVWTLISEVLAARTEGVRNQTKRLVAQVNVDVLTGLGSRLYLSDRIERVLMHVDRPQSALLFVDLDGFKVINDTYGHSAGDELLVAVARRIGDVLRPDDVAVRLGGDQFAVLLEGCAQDHAKSLAQHLLSSLSAPYELSRGRVAVTAGIGIVDVVPPATAELVMRDAERAMSEAKSGGRNQVCVYEGAMEERTIHRLELEIQLRDALAGGQFELHYQPVVHAGVNAIIGAEALLRWRHPQRGLLAPDDFLAVSEDIGLMVQLGDWVLRQACEQARRWQSVDPARAFSVAVNLSAPEMFSVDLIGRVRAALEESGLPGKLLVLEITERIMMADGEKATRQLAELRKLGVRIAVDDFGTGYSSLAHVRDLPLDILKIDRSFVTRLGLDHQALALVRSIVGIAKALDLDVIVEGTETAAQIELLDELGCHVVQGFYFGRPITADEFQSRITWSGARSVDRRGTQLA
jgi:diguanylate cyclase